MPHALFPMMTNRALLCRSKWLPLQANGISQLTEIIDHNEAY